MEVASSQKERWQCSPQAYNCSNDFFHSLIHLLTPSPSFLYLGVCCCSEVVHTTASEGGGGVQVLHPPHLHLPARVGQKVEDPRLCI